MKKSIASKLSLRAKFKDFDTVEVCIISSETGEIQMERIPILLAREFPAESQAVTNRRKKNEAKTAVDEADEVKVEPQEGADNDSHSNENE